ncbi:MULTISPECIES: DUF262 domain-containing protein [Pseudomonadati]|uniref:DUF262 domain-containing protein n=1 Tax=Shewanella aestuarii TaxID=1028752 RepID=A0ABT0KWW0_9GAMM|nr:DUF262 domain-containing protein [Shewanella aestuarii]MCL1115864.1 DUF262 domain-containing protein [Shewanella aestuarii]GGN69246.1 hypothetical protein GCM10009193_02960 [Shewanella aestuarii]
MSIRIDRKSNTMTISSLNEGRILKKFNLNPEYQRKSVWSDEQQSLLIDSILKNIPIPPIFLREHIDKQGKTYFEVIDGKQRLTSIFRFIDNEISTIDDDTDPLHDDGLAGLTFSDLESNDGLESILEEFWRYPLPIEYVYTKDDKVVDKIFDRLNRSGEKLTGQELRHSNYYDSPLISLAFKIAKSEFWNDELEITNKNRMEDIELISELIFLLIEGVELSSTQKLLDDYYAKYARSTVINWEELEQSFSGVDNILKGFELNFSDYNVSGVSHLYGVWAFSYYCFTEGKGTSLKEKLHEFFSVYKNADYQAAPEIARYKQSMMNATKGKSQRTKRKSALIEFCLR